MSTPATANPADWIGREEAAVDVIDPRPARLMQATLDLPIAAEPGAPLPPLWHWLYFPDQTPGKALGPDGHAARGGLVPPVTLPRRMWAGGRFTFTKPLQIGETVQRTSIVRDIAVKQGRSGDLCFVATRHDFHVNGERRFREEHTAVFRDHPAPDAAPPAPRPAPEHSDWQRRIEPGPVLLFRYSALTFNGHRIHYDLDYCRNVEGYPGLVVHGPLTATFLMDLLNEHVPGATIAELTIRAVSPLFDTAPFTIAGKRNGDDTVDLWACTPEGALALQATATLA